MSHNLNQQKISKDYEISASQSRSSSLDFSSKFNKGKWSAEEDEFLKGFVLLYGEKNWKKISYNMKKRSSIQCLHRWTKILKPGLVKGPWSVEEDKILLNWVKNEGYFIFIIIYIFFFLQSYY